MAINRKVLTCVAAASAFTTSACVTMQSSEQGCLIYEVPQDCHGAVDLQNFLALGSLSASNLGNGSLDEVLIAEYGLSRMTDQQVVNDFRPRFINQTPDGARKFTLARQIIDARDNRQTLILRGEDLTLLGIENQTVVVIQPNQLDGFIQDNQDAINRIARPRNAVLVPQPE